jgi:hypothetical protein
MPKKTYRHLPVRIEDAAALKERIASEHATPEEAREYRRVFNILRAKFHAGSLSPENARRLGIE